MKAQLHEIGPGIYRISTFVPEINLAFNQFLVNDEQPFLMHTGPKQMFPLVRDAVAQVIDPSRLHWIGFSHFEADECGSLNEWLAIAPHATAVCSFVGALVNVNDFAIRPARALEHGEEFQTGEKRFRFLHTPHVPHSWDAGVFFETTGKTLFTSDLFHQNGELPALSQQSIMDKARSAIASYQKGPFAHYVPYTARTDSQLEMLAELEPQLLATMHGSSYQGDGKTAIRELAGVWRELLAA